MRPTNHKSTRISMLSLYALLISRVFLFAFFQIIVAVFLKSWADSAKYWMLTATLTNVISIIILSVQFKKDGINYISIFRFRTEAWKKDLAQFSVLALLSIILVMATPILLESWLWGDTTYTQDILFQPISKNLVYFLLLAFPITIGMAELATYFGYIMPRLEKHFHAKWLAVLFPVLFLSIQHCTLPLVLDPKFILFRGLSYLPFALLVGLALHKRPALLPYFAILHIILDASAATLFLIKF